MDKNISRLRNGLQLDGYVNADGSIDYLKDKDGNVIFGADANGRYYGKAFDRAVGAVTANADGLTDAIIPANLDFVTITSSGATQQASLPVATSATIGKKLDLYVGSNGLELLAGAGNQLINTVDADGTNQLDVPANTIMHCLQITASAWYVWLETATTLSKVAPDND